MLAAAIVVECRLPGDDQQRVFALVDAGPAAQPRWRLSVRARRLGPREVELPLAAAEVDARGDRVTVSARSANGGVAVDLDATAGASRLAVFVNFELEVNVWRDLSPDVELMNTEGIRDDAQCRILSAPPPMP